MGNSCGNEYSSLSGTTSLNLQKGYLKWKIENFQLLALSNKVAGGNMNDVAYTFSFGSEISIPANWKLYLNLEKDAEDPNLGLYLKVVDYTGTHDELWMQCGFKLKSPSGKYFSTKLKSPQNLRIYGIGWSKIAALSYILSKYVSTDGSLLIEFKIKQFSRSDLNFKGKEPDQKTLKQVDLQNSAFALRDFATLFETGMHSDCEISVDGKVFLVHKNILAARSSVFQAMFQSEMKESSSGVINVEDISYSTMKLLLQFLYSGRLEDKVDSIHDLIYAADKYCVKGLMDSCEQNMMKNITTSNALELYLLAKRHQLKNAVPAISAYISKRFHPILQDSLSTL